MNRPRSGFLKFIIAYKAFTGVAGLIVSGSFFRFVNGDIEAGFTKLAITLNLDPQNHIVHSVISKLGMIENGTFLGITIAVFLIGVLNLVEAWGLHLRQRWAEWLTVFATGLLIPLEAYEVYKEVTVIRVFILLLNMTIVYYLAKHKELFKGWGQKEPSI